MTSTSPIDQILALAVSQLGETETPLRSNRTKFGAYLDSIRHAPTPRQGSAWCGTFIDWCFVVKEMLVVLDGVNHYGTSIAFQQWRKRGRTSTTPHVGDLAFRASSGPGHIGIVESVHGTKVTCIEGNTSRSMLGSQTNGGEVCRRTREASWWRAGYAQPYYERVSVTPPPPINPPTALWRPQMKLVQVTGAPEIWLLTTDGTRRLITRPAESVLRRSGVLVDGATAAPMLLTPDELAAFPIAA
jgi:hypothetical protein